MGDKKKLGKKELGVLIRYAIVQSVLKALLGINVAYTILSVIGTMMIAYGTVWLYIIYMAGVSYDLQQALKESINFDLMLALRVNINIVFIGIGLILVDRYTVYKDKFKAYRVFNYATLALVIPLGAYIGLDVYNIMIYVPLTKESLDIKSMLYGTSIVASIAMIASIIYSRFDEEKSMQKLDEKINKIRQGGK